MGRIMALDVGDRRIGIAMTDMLCILAQPYKTISFNSNEEKIVLIKNLIEEKEIEKVIIGIPKNMDSTEGHQAQVTREFVKKLEQNTDVEIELIDERLTTKKAYKDLSHLSIKKIKKKKLIDTQAAVNILETYLNKKSLKTGT